MIELRNITVSKAGTKLYRDFSLKIPSDENWLISGSNGSGKTLLLEVLAGILHLSQGETFYEFIAGETWEERYTEKRKHITYIPTTALHSFLSGSEDLYYQQRYYGIGDQKVPLVKDLFERGGELLKLLNIPASLSIEHLLNVEVTRLSNGQLKKLLLLKSFAKGIPKLLLLDYPFEGLDYESREDLCQFIDFVCSKHNMQVMIADNHHHVPSVITKKLTIENFSIENIEQFNGTSTREIKIRPDALAPRVTNGNEILRIENLRLKYGDREIFKDFNWTVHKGDRWVLIGRNGAGKTTLFSMIYADHPIAYTQKLFLFGKRRGTGESIWDIKKRINYLGPEQTSYMNSRHAWLTARDYIRNFNDQVNDEDFENLIQHFQASDFIDKPVRNLSSGEMQLVLIMNCFLVPRELLLLDEPFRFLDARNKDLVMKYLLSRLNPEVTLILITHFKEDIPDHHSFRIHSLAEDILTS